ncbi:CYTH domain-containing protein [Peristeroidobacter soli]|uniref:CYTH domain-containing protein n=1 Tax=Peristeroidobacter soli TaxID=2497877 RepID=UPI00101BBA1D|nr:CYTH domain-containing protein [Peristeroidobacter soli]
MATEIERKFLVRGEAWRQQAPLEIRQGYLNRDKQRTVRVRISGARAYLTVKGMAKGLARPEFEYEIPVADAEQMLSLCDGPLLEKRRHVTTHAGRRWEVDEFLGENAGLIVAEVELEDEHQVFQRPDWLDTEVTDDPRYLNSNLGVHPYARW